MNIDVEKSIRTKNLKARNLSFFQKIDSIFDSLVPLMMFMAGLVFPVLILFQSIKESREVAIFPFVIFSPFIFLGFLSLYALIYGNRLARFEGINEELNRKTLLGILELRFKVPIDETDGGAVIIYKEASFLRFGMRVTVIFRGSDIFMNITRFNYRGLKSPFHPFIDSFEVRSIITEFSDRIKKAA